MHPISWRRCDPTPDGSNKVEEVKVKVKHMMLHLSVRKEKKHFIGMMKSVFLLGFHRSQVVSRACPARCVSQDLAAT